MISKAWIDKRKTFWDRLAVMLERAGKSGIRSLSNEELQETALLYRQIASDLSALRQDRTAKSQQQQLNALLVRAHNVIYSERRKGAAAIWRFFRYDYPVLFRKLLTYNLFSLALLLGGGAVGALLAMFRPEFVTHMLGPEMLDTIHRHKMWTLSINSMAPAASSGIMTNNLSVTFSAFAGGITGGLGTMYLLGFNGLLLGVIGVVCAQNQLSIPLWSFVAPHGSLELPAILIGGAAGLRLGAGLLFPGMYSRGHSVALAGAESARLLAGVIPLLMIAGVFEGFFSPSMGIPVPLKFTVGAILFSLLLLWLLRTGRPKPASV